MRTALRFVPELTPAPPGNVTADVFKRVYTYSTLAFQSEVRASSVPAPITHPRCQRSTRPGVPPETAASSVTCVSASASPPVP